MSETNKHELVGLLEHLKTLSEVTSKSNKAGSLAGPNVRDDGSITEVVESYNGACGRFNNLIKVSFSHLKTAYLKKIEYSGNPYTWYNAEEVNKAMIRINHESIRGTKILESYLEGLDEEE